MMQALTPYSTARTAEIMARYRPIAPKPEAPVNSNGDSPTDGIPQSIRNSPYLMNVWPHLQARPTRTRKRGRTALGPPAVKRARTCLQGLSPPYHVTPSPSQTLAFQGFAHDPNGIPQFAFAPNLVPLKCGLDCTPVTTPSNSIALPFMPCAAATARLPILTKLPETVVLQESSAEDEGIDLNKAVEVPDELDFMPQLQGPTKSAVIAPQAVRPIGSSISVGRIREDPCGRSAAKQVMKKSEEVEKKVESEVLPAIVSDSNNKVRLTNSAYNEMVGQPECCWLDCMPCSGSAGGGSGNACKRRIGGEVVLEFLDSRVPMSSNGFTCWVRIEWGNKEKKSVVNAFCDVIRLACESKDYLFEWRFHIREASESNA